MKAASRPSPFDGTPAGIESRARSIIRDLRALADPVRAESAQRFFKEPVASLGIDAATLRQYTRGQIGQLKSVWTAPDAVKLCDHLLVEPEIDIRGTGIAIVGGFARELDPGFLPTANRWLKTRLDNWALVDSFCSCVLSPLLDRHPAVEKTLRQWSREKSLWVRRASLVTLVPFARRGRFLDLSYQLAGEHFADPEDLMHKATGWLLREAGKKDMPGLKRFLLKNGPGIPRTALRYAIERFPAAERAGLLRSTRPITK